MMSAWDVARIAIGGVVVLIAVGAVYRVAAAQTAPGPFNVASTAELVAWALNPSLGIIIAALAVFFALTRDEWA